MRGGFWRQILWIAIILVCLLRFIPVVQQAATRPSHGYHSYYTASRLLIAGERVVQFYDNDWFRAAARHIQPDADDIFIPNMPVTAYLLLPVAWLDYMTARLVWTLLGLLILVVATVWSLHTCKVSRSYWLMAFIIILLYQPLYAQLAQAQAYLLLTGLLVALWAGYRQKQSIIVGSILGLMFIFKSAGILFFLLLLSQRRWRALTIAIGTVGSVVLITLPRLGFDSWLVYSSAMRVFTAQPFTMSVAYQSLPGFIKRLVIADPEWNPQPLFAITEFGDMLSLVGTLVIISVTVYAALCRLDADHAFAAFTTAGVIISPFSGDYHYLLLLLPSVILASASPGRWQWMGLLIAVTLIGMHVDLEHLLQLHPLLAYPKLYGALIIWCLALSPVSKVRIMVFR